MLKIVIDSSVWISGLLSDRGASYEVLLKGLKGEFELITSLNIINEVTRVIKELDILNKVRRPEDIRNLIELLSSKSRTVSLELHVLRDPNDDIILACALEHHAHYLISLDKDLTDLMSYENVLMIRPGDFLKMFRDGGGL